MCNAECLNNLKSKAVFKVNSLFIASSKNKNGKDRYKKSDIHPVELNNTLQLITVDFYE